MLKPLDSPRAAVRRRTYSSQFKADLVAACQHPGASIAALALQHGMNANVLHRWLKEYEQGRHRLAGVGATAAVESPDPPPAFVPMALGAPAPSQRAASAATASTRPDPLIRIDCQRPGLCVSITWPLSGATECAQLLREFLR